MKIKMYLKYLHYVIDHKIRYYKKAKKYGRLRALTHDMSKFSIAEFKPYAENFFGEKKCEKCAKCGYCDKEKEASECKDYKYKDFNKAWEHHFTRNKHHWNYWLIDTDSDMNGMGIISDYKWVVKEMDDMSINEMICDWEAMADKFGDSAQLYYLTHYNKIDLNDNTRMIVEWKLNLNMSYECNYGHTIKQFVDMYDEETFNQCIGDYIIENYNLDMYNILKD